MTNNLGGSVVDSGLDLAEEPNLKFLRYRLQGNERSMLLRFPAHYPFGQVPTRWISREAYAYGEQTGAVYPGNARVVGPALRTNRVKRRIPD
jgi:hypothetical protein